MQLNSELHVKYVCIMYMRKKHLKNADRFPKMSIFIAVDGRSHDLFACGPEFRLLLSRKVKSKRQNIVQKILKVHISPNLLLKYLMTLQTFGAIIIIIISFYSFFQNKVLQYLRTLHFARKALARLLFAYPNVHSKWR